MKSETQRRIDECELISYRLDENKNIVFIYKEKD